MNSPAPVSICIAICSRRRPELLAVALDTIFDLTRPEHVTLSVMVVENDDTPKYAQIIKEYSSKLTMEYRTEPEPGLTYVRNKALDEADKLGVDWMASIDDDCELEQSWLVHMANAITAYPDTHMFTGRQMRVPNPLAPQWFPKYGLFESFKTGAKLNTGTTANLLIHRSVLAKDQTNLRFDHSFCFTGGEDSDFTMRYNKSSEHLRYVHEAETSEISAHVRKTVSDLVQGTQSASRLLCKLRYKNESVFWATVNSLQVVYRGSVLGLANVIICGVAYPFNKDWAMLRLGVGLKFLYQAKGIVSYFFTKQPEPYKGR